MASSIKRRVKELPPPFRQSLVQARHKLGLTQSELGQRIGLPQMHISGIETGRVVPRFDTLLELVRALDFDLMLIPRNLKPVVESLIQTDRHKQGRDGESDEDRPLYALDDSDDAAP